MDYIERRMVFANLVLTAILVLVAVYYAVQLKSPIQLGGVDDVYEPLMSKLARHDDLKDYKGIYPIVSRISRDDIVFAKQNNITLLSPAKEGDYLLTYQGMIVVYDFKGNRIVNKFEQPRAPLDLLTKLYAHEEVADHSGLVPRATRLDDQILNTALANNQQFFAKARSGDYLFEWDDMTVLYDYGNDRIINTIRRPKVPSDFVQKLLAHPEVAGHDKENPTITQLDQNLLEQGRNANPGFFGNAQIGQFLLQWSDLAIIYDYSQDKLVATFVPPRLPADFMAKFGAHSQAQQFASQNPRVSLLTEAGINQLVQQFPAIKNVTPGDYLLLYTDNLVVYDYNNDVLKGIYEVQ